MQLALSADRTALRTLGLPAPCRLEERSVDGRSRYDLLGEGMVVECKQAASLRDLTQVERSLNTLARERGGQWPAHIVFGRWAARGLRAAVGSHARVRLWRCDGDGERPVLVEVQ